MSSDLHPGSLCGILKICCMRPSWNMLSIVFSGFLFSYFLPKQAVALATAGSLSTFFIHTFAVLLRITSVLLAHHFLFLILFFFPLINVSSASFLQTMILVLSYLSDSSLFPLFPSKVSIFYYFCLSTFLHHAGQNPLCIFIPLVLL